MRLTHDQLRNMDLNLRSGAKVRIDADGCIDAESEIDQQFCLATGWKETSAPRAPRAMRGLDTAAPNGPLWPGGPSKEDVLDLRRYATETAGKLAEADQVIADLRADNELLRESIDAQTTETAASEPKGAAEGEGETGKPSRKPKAPKPA